MTHSFRQLICNLLVFVLLFNTLTPIAVYASQTLLGEQNKVLICTTDGFKWVESESIKQTDLDQNIEQRLHCPMCILHDDIDDNVVSHKCDYVLFIDYTVLKRSKQSDRVSNTLYLHEQGSRAPPVIL